MSIAQRTTAMHTSCSEPRRSNSGLEVSRGNETNATPTMNANSTTCSICPWTIAFRGLPGKSPMTTSGSSRNIGGVGGTAAEESTSATTSGFLRSRYSPGSMSRGELNAERRRDRRRRHEESDHPQSEAPKLGDIGSARKPFDDGCKDKRDDNHLNRHQEQAPRKCQPVADHDAGLEFNQPGFGPDRHPDEQPEKHGDQHLQPKLAFHQA